MKNIDERRVQKENDKKNKQKNKVVVICINGEQEKTKITAGLS